MRVKLLFIALLMGMPAASEAQSRADFFDPNVLHEIRLEMRPEEWTRLKQNFLENTYYPADFVWKFKGQEIVEPQIGIRSRGLGSRSALKPGLRMDFDRFDVNNRFFGLKSFVLRNNTQDASMLRERVAMEIFRRMGIPAPREAHARLFVNNEYIGLYTIVESIDRDFLKTNLNEDEGFLYSYQYQSVYAFEYLGADPSRYSPVPFEPETNQTKPEPAPLEAMIRAINQSSDSSFVAEVSRYLDLTKYITQLAVENYLAEQDGLVGDFGLNNFFLYRLKGGTVHQFIPWDKSNAFFRLDWPILRNIETNVLSRRALAVPELMALYRDVLSRTAALAGGPGGFLETEIQRVYEQIRAAAYADTNKQCDPIASGTLRLCSNADFDQAVAFMIDFARQRAALVTSQLAGGRTDTRNFSITNLGGFSAIAAAAENPIAVGYARILPEPGNSIPAGLAIFGVRSGSTLISEAGVPASPIFRSGRIYAEVAGPVNTGVAMANPNNQPVVVSFFFTDSGGRDFGQGNTTIPPNGQIAQFLDSPPFNGGANLFGTFTFSASQPIAAVALRGLTNERGEFLITTLPVTETGADQGAGLTFPHFADGGGWTTQIVLVNPGDQQMAGSVQFLSQGSGSTAAQPVVIATPDGRADSSFNYIIPAKTAFRLRTAGAAAAVRSGSIRVNASGGTATPAGVVVFTFRNAGVTVTEAGVPAVRHGSAFRLYAESSGNFSGGAVGAIQTGLAITNRTNAVDTVNFEITTLEGSSIGVSGSITVPPNGQSALFMNQIPGFDRVPQTFKGILRVSASSGDISMVGLRGRYNERGDFLITTTPPVNEGEVPSSTEMLFPHLVEGGGYTTQFILFSARTGQNTTGSLRFLGQNGRPLTLTIR